MNNDFFILFLLSNMYLISVYLFHLRLISSYA